MLLGLVNKELLCEIGYTKDLYQQHSESLVPQLGHQMTKMSRTLRRPT
jgi:hypothetical protein